MDINYKYRIARRKLQYKIGKPIWTEYPDNIMLDLTNRCCNDCVFCNVQHSFNLPHGDMPLPIAEQVLRHYGKKLFWSIAPFVNGESMLVPDTLQKVCSLSESVCNTQCVIDTTGAVYKNRQALIHRNLKLVRFTISAVTPETYLKTHGRPNFEEAMKTFDFYIKNKLPTQNAWVHFIACKENEHELEQWIEKFKGYGRTVYPMHRGTGIQLNSEIALGSKVEKPFHVFPDGKRVPVHDLMKNTKPCPCYDILGISWQGEILECVDFPYKYNYGKVGEVDLDKAWKERLKNKMDNECCNSCNLRFSNYKEILNKWVK